MGYMFPGEKIMERQFAETLMYEELQRIATYKERWRLYRGQHDKPLRVKPNQPDDNVTVNFAGLIVNKGVSFLFGDEVQFNTDSERERNADEQRLDAIWDANRKPSTLQKLALNGAIAGTGYVMLVERDPLTGNLPRILVLDPEMMFPTWDEEDVDLPIRWRMQWPSVDSQTGKAVERRKLITPANGDPRTTQTWDIVDEIKRSNKWEPLRDARWNYPFSPIVHCQNLPMPNSFYGLSDLEDDVIGLNGSINFSLSNTGRILKFHAHPKTWVTGTSAKGIDASVDGVIGLPSADARIGNLEMQSDLASSIEYYRELRQALHAVARVPEIATGKMDAVGQLSALAMEILYEPLVEKTKQKRNTYGDLLREVNRRLLAITGGPDDVMVSNQWGGMLQRDSKSEAETALLWKQVGVSDATLMERAGFDPDREATLRQSQADAQAQADLAAFDRGVGQ